jgi:hypothetical protein
VAGDTAGVAGDAAGLTGAAEGRAGLFTWYGLSCALFVVVAPGWGVEEPWEGGVAGPVICG